MAFFQLPSGNFGYYNSKYGSYSPEHGWVYNNQREETELVNSIVDDKLAEYSRRAEAELEQAIKRAVQEYGNQVWERLLAEMVRVLETDIVSEVQIGFDGCRDIFQSKQAQKYVSDKIYTAMKAELNRIRSFDIR